MVGGRGELKKIYIYHNTWTIHLDPLFCEALLNGIVGWLKFGCFGISCMGWWKSKKIQDINVTAIIKIGRFSVWIIYAFTTINSSLALI